MTLRSALFLLALLLAPGLALAQATATETDGFLPHAVVDRNTMFFREVVETLASPQMEGRRTGTPGAEMARDYLQEQLREILREAGIDDGGVAALPFDVTRGIKVAGEPRAEVGGSELLREVDYTVAPFSGSGSVADAPLVFASYGIVAPELGWDDYKDLDVGGAVVVIVRGEPQAKDPESRFAGDQPSVYSDLRRKASTARDRGAAALLVLNNPLTDEADELPVAQPTYSAATFDIPVVFVRRSHVEPLLEAAAGHDLRTLLEAMDRYGSPASTALGEQQATVDVKIERDLVTGYNVVGVIPGTDPALREDYVIIGAHYDHLGHGGTESLAPGSTEIHPGADDNASGVAAVLELARAAALSDARRRSVMVVLFDAEEIGAVGSAFFTAQLPVPQERVFAMLNFDMVGRLRDDKLVVGGVGTAAEFEELLAGAARHSPLTLERDASGFGASDHMNFVTKDIPVLFFFTGPHEDYHKPSDTPEKVNYAGIEQIVYLAQDVLGALLARLEPLTYVDVAPAAPPARSRGNLTVTLGTVPAYIEGQVEGMAIGDVVTDGPAEAAGLRGGDVIVRIGEKKVANIYDFMYALEGRNPGETVEVAVIRDGAELTFEVKLAARNVQQ